MTTLRRAALRQRLTLFAAVAVLAAAGAFMVVRDAQLAEGVVLDPACDTATGAPDSSYLCVKLLNKGTGAPVGRLFVKNDGGTLRLVTDLDTLGDVGHVEEKLCIDDDANPREDRVSCLGGTAGTTISRSYAIGTGRNDVKPPFDTRFEEAAGKYEYMLERAALGEDQSGARATYSALVGTSATPPATYTDFSFHFNNGNLSIEAFFNLAPNATLLECEVPEVLGGGTSPTQTVLMDGANCPAEKAVLFNAGTDTDGTQFVNLRPANGSTALSVLFLEKIEWLGKDAGSALPLLYYDDTGTRQEMPTCEVDPRVGAPGSPTFDLPDTLTVTDAEANVLPGTHTSCLVDIEDFKIVDGTLYVTHIVFNVGDGGRFW